MSNYGNEFPSTPASSGDRQARGNKVIEELIELVDLFPSRDGRACAKLPAEDGGLRTYPVRSNMMRAHVVRRFFKYSRAADSRLVSETIDILEAEAFARPVRNVFVRFARIGDCAYYDLGPGSRCVELDANDWREVPDAPVEFLRPPGMQALPPPTLRVGGVRIQHSPCGLEFEEDSLLTGWGACAVAGFPVPVLRTTGSSGILLARLGRQLLDPHDVPLRATPKDRHDLSIYAAHSGIVALGPERKLSSGQEAGITGLTGGVAFGKRAMHSDFNEVIFDSRRPVIVCHTPDAKMSSEFEAASIAIGFEKSYPSPRQVDELLREHHPAILGRTLTAAVRVLRASPDSFEEALYAVGEYLRLPRGAFAQILSEQRMASRTATLDAFPVVSCLKGLAPWEGTATTLLTMLNRRAPAEERIGSNWPTSAAALSNQLRRLQPLAGALRVDSGVPPEER